MMSAHVLAAASLSVAALALGQPVELAVEIPTRGMEEPCFSLPEGSRLEFSFTATAPLDFNLHYHSDGVFFPIEKRAVLADAGQYISPLERTYCLMWTNKQQQPVELQYRYQIYTESSSQ